MKNYDIIFFDVDDTLFDFTKSEQEAFSKVIEKYDLVNGIHQYKKSYKEISKVLWSDLENGKMSISKLGSERFRRLFVEHKLEIDAVAFNRDYLGFLGQQTFLVQGAEMVIAALSHKRLAIITNGFAEVQTSRINNSLLKGRFEHVIISEFTGFQKPQTGIFDYAFEKLQITDKSSVLIVGDSLTSDIQGGINYGIDTCWFNPQHKDNNTRIQPTYEIKELESLIHIIQ
ncbi:2-haloacid dehalogenase [Paenibacillus cellulosilyticus]|uniref:2-haloacid dehalogenase n=1 Tax=Paenibacillus cellulosilyticus TaxID=375489 RepID=A0A2V2YT57_9BACL|nr:YjjG family noncanonical pyrimidine nucleotidase [Paenibacillus cellulosilyticus]PWW02563.1 2-haloacid dehalogenase [Paenibacillus cellulosilyticus]QKS47254.1 noncanonical pyrimidine nucleotidase, YjjG family [Paenibacillus cellulosilyticus]